MAPETKAVEILGFFQDRYEAPLNPDSEVWGLNQLEHAWPELKYRWSRWFEMHALDYLKGWKPSYVDWLARQTKPIYMQAHYPEIPSSVEFPRQRVNVELGRRFGFSHDYFTSSFSYMVALALLEGFNKIGLYGIGLIEDGECLYERAGLEYLVGLAQGSGAEVRFGKASPMLRIHYVYGYSEPRMNLADVEPVCRFLEQNAQVCRDHMDSLESMLLELPLGSPEFQRATNGLVDLRMQRETFKDVGTWLKHYGRGGSLIAADGTLTK